MRAIKSTITLLSLSVLCACSGIHYADNGGVAKVTSVNGSIVMHPRGAGDKEMDLSTVNGKIDIGKGYTLGNVGTVNGRIHLGPETSAKNVKTVNGSISIKDNCVAENLRTINGAIRVEASEINGNVKTINGSVKIRDGSKIGGSVLTTNGSITLDQVSVSEDVEMARGKIDIENSTVEGNIIVNKKHYWWIFDIPWRDPKVVIGPNAIIKGQIIAHRDINLFIHESAQVGGIEGANAKYYSSTRP